MVNTKLPSVVTPPSIYHIPSPKNMNHDLLILILFSTKIITKLKSKFRPNSVHMTHVNVFIYPYLMRLLNILYCLLFKMLSRQALLTTSNLTSFPVKFI